LACLANKPVVDRLQAKLKDRAIVFRFDILDERGREIANRYSVSATPTFLMFNKSGKEVIRQSGSVPTLEHIERMVFLDNNNGAVD
jgi:thioredoxin-related protein